MSDPQPHHTEHGRSAVAPLIKMVNQIAINMPGSGDEHATSVAAHINKFWSPPMRRQICEYCAADGKGLNPSAKRAVQLLGSSQGLSE